MAKKDKKICGVCLNEAKEGENCPYFEDEDCSPQPHIINPGLKEEA